MKRIATITSQKGHIIGLIHGPDATGQSVTVNGKVWRFDFDEWAGPIWLRKDGTERSHQCPPDAVWAEFEKWLKAWRNRK